jgi:hypothetical protein
VAWSDTAVLGAWVTATFVLSHKIETGTPPEIKSGDVATVFGQSDLPLETTRASKVKMVSWARQGFFDPMRRASRSGTHHFLHNAS